MIGKGKKGEKDTTIIFDRHPPLLYYHGKYSFREVTI